MQLGNEGNLKTSGCQPWLNTYLAFLILFELFLLVLSLMNWINFWLVLTLYLYEDPVFKFWKKLYLDTRWKQLHPRLGFIALDRSQNPGRHPKRNHCFLYTEQNDWWSLYIFGESHLIIIKINVYWVLTIAKHYSKSFTSIINALSWHNPKI